MIKTFNAKTQKELTPEVAIQLLKEGNARFVNNLKANRDLLQQVNETSESQHPFAFILSCIDSRTSAELIFDHWPGLPGYIEIEAPTEDKLIELANKFELDMNEKPGGFAKMYQELYQPKIDDIAKLNISFDNINETVKPLVSKNIDLFEKIVEGQKKLLEKVNKST